MALKLKSNQYLKIEYVSSNQFKADIYADKRTRDLTKKSTSYVDICNKYEELIEHINADILLAFEKYAIDNLKIIARFAAINKLSDDARKEIITLQEIKSDLHFEYEQYKAEYAQQKGAQSQFLIMKKYIKDVAKSIPNVKYISRMSINTLIDDLPGMYEYVKEHKIFGDTKDC